MARVDASTAARLAAMSVWCARRLRMKPRLAAERSRHTSAAVTEGGSSCRVGRWGMPRAIPLLIPPPKRVSAEVDVAAVVAVKEGCCERRGAPPPPALLRPPASETAYEVAAT